MFDIQSLISNENFYRKLALTLAILRSVPPNLTPREYAKQLQNNFRRKRLNELIENEQIRKNISILRTSTSITIPKRSQDLLKHYGEFLQKLSINSLELTMEIEILLLDTIKRIFELMKENLSQLIDENDRNFFQQLINLILNFDPMPTIREHCIEYFRDFLDQIFILLKQSKSKSQLQILIEHIGEENFLQENKF